MLYQGRLDVDGGGGEGVLLSGFFIPTKGVIRDIIVLPSVPISSISSWKYTPVYSGKSAICGKRFMVSGEATCVPDSVVKTKRNKSDWLFGNNRAAGVNST
jgi:hypothetical protein